MPHSVNQAGAVKGIFVQKLFEVFGHLILIFPICNIALHILKHLDNLDIRTAVLWPLERAEGSGNGGIGVRPGGGDDMRGEGGVVASAVLRMEHKGKVENLGFQLRIAAVRAQDAQDVLRCGELWQRVVDEEAFAVVIIIIGMIAVNRQQGEGCNQLQALAQHVINADIVCIVVVRIERQHATGERVHHVGARRL